MEISIESIIDAMKIGASSELGIIALIVVTMSIVGVVMFRGARDAIKLGVYVVLMFGVCTFAYASIQVIQKATPSGDDSPISSSKKVSSLEPITEPKISIPELSLVEEAEESEILFADKGYVYLGTYRDGSWIDSRFKNANFELNAGDIVELKTDRRMFECAPYRKHFYSVKFTFCNKVIGSVEAGQNVKLIERPKTIGLSRVWGYVKELK